MIPILLLYNFYYFCNIKLTDKTVILCETLLNVIKKWCKHKHEIKRRLINDKSSLQFIKLIPNPNQKWHGKLKIYLGLCNVCRTAPPTLKAHWAKILLLMYINYQTQRQRDWLWKMRCVEYYVTNSSSSY